MGMLTVHDAAGLTGWSARMLRYLERIGLLVPPRSDGGYRVYGAAEIRRLRSLRELVDTHAVGLSDVAFAKRLRDDPILSDALAAWLEAWSTPVAASPRATSDPGSDWLRFEQDKSLKLLASSTTRAA